MMSTNELIIMIPLVGKSFVFNDSNTTNISTILPLLPVGDGCKVSLDYNGIIYYGHGRKEGDEIIVTFTTEIVVPSGMCIVFDCVGEPEAPCKDAQIPITDDLRIAVVDDKGCPLGWILLKDLVDYIKDMFPKTLCELIGVGSMPIGNLVASDYILTVGDDCDLKGVPPTDIACKEPGSVPVP